MAIFFSSYQKKREFEPRMDVGIEERLPQVMSAQKYVELLGVSRNIAEDFFSRLPFEEGVSLAKPSKGVEADFVIQIGDVRIPIKFSTKEDINVKEIPKDVILITGDIEEFYKAYLKGLENDEAVSNPANNLSEAEKQQLLSQFLIKLPPELQNKLMIKAEQKDKLREKEWINPKQEPGQ